VNKATAEICWAGGTGGEVQEYLPVILANLTVSTLENKVVIQWDTASEINNLGMNLWCAQLAEDQFEGITPLNSQLISIANLFQPKLFYLSWVLPIPQPTIRQSTPT